MSAASPATAASRTLPRAIMPGPGRPLSQNPDFDLVALAARGSFAEIWKVRKHPGGEICALKQLRADCVNQPAARQILVNEGEIGRKVASQFVVKVCESDVEGSPAYLLLEWLEGQTLEGLLATRKKLFCREALWIARQCAQGMHDLLIAGYTHGDVKPANIFILDDGTVKLIDLGFARPDQLPAIDLCAAQCNSLSGTPDYLAPEALVPHLSPGHASGISRDIYSLGVTLYRMLTGSLPFQGQTVAEVLRQHQQAIPAPLRSAAPEVPREVAELVHRLLSKQSLRRGDGLSWLIRDLIGLELEFLENDAGNRLGSHLYRNQSICQNSHA